MTRREIIVGTISAILAAVISITIYRHTASVDISRAIVLSRDSELTDPSFDHLSIGQIDSSVVLYPLCEHDEAMYATHGSKRHPVFKLYVSFPDGIDDLAIPFHAVSVHARRLSTEIKSKKDNNHEQETP